MRSAPVFLALALAALLLAAQPAAAQQAISGQTLYVPVYSHVYHGPKNRPFPLTCTLSIRSTDMTRNFQVLSVDFYNSHGKLVRNLVQEPQLVGPMNTLEYIVHENDNDGGSGANFVVRWSAEQALSAPLVEAVMIGTSSNQGISFVTRGVEMLP